MSQPDFRPPPPPPAPPRPPRPWWATLLIAIAVISGVLLFGAITVVGLILYTCSHH